MQLHSLPKTLGELKENKYKVLSVKDEIRKNLICRLKLKQEIFKGIIGCDNTVVPAISNAILAKHDIIFLGLRGQAKTKIAKDEGDESVSYKDMLGSMLKDTTRRSGRQSTYDLEEDWNY